MEEAHGPKVSQQTRVTHMPEEDDKTKGRAEDASDKHGALVEAATSMDPGL